MSASRSAGARSHIWHVWNRMSGKNSLRWKSTETPTCGERQAATPRSSHNSSLGASRALCAGRIDVLVARWLAKGTIPHSATWSTVPRDSCCARGWCACRERARLSTAITPEAFVQALLRVSARGTSPRGKSAGVIRRYAGCPCASSLAFSGYWKASARERQAQVVEVDSRRRSRLAQATPSQQRRTTTGQDRTSSPMSV
jgi:hypothetical protein